MTHKRCSSCFFTMPYCFFNKRRASQDGLAYVCRICDNFRSKQWRAANPDRMAELSRRHYAANRSHHLKLCRAWVEANAPRRRAICKSYFERNRAKVMDANRKWRDSNVAKVRSIAMRRHTVKLKATPPWLTEDQWCAIENVYSHARDCEVVSGETYQVDHIIPLQGQNVCGLHVPWNLQILPRDLNASKGNKYDSNYPGL